MHRLHEAWAKRIKKCSAFLPCTRVTAPSVHPLLSLSLILTTKTTELSPATRRRNIIRTTPAWFKFTNKSACLQKSRVYIIGPNGCDIESGVWSVFALSSLLARVNTIDNRMNYLSKNPLHTSASFTHRGWIRSFGEIKKKKKGQQFVLSLSNKHAENCLWISQKVSSAFDRIE